MWKSDPRLHRFLNREIHVLIHRYMDEQKDLKHPFRIIQLKQMSMLSGSRWLSILDLLLQYALDLAMACGRPVLVVDVGSGTLRLGVASVDPAVARRGLRSEANGWAEPFPERGIKDIKVAYGQEIATLASYQLHRPSHRGLLLDVQQQKVIWRHVIDRLDLGAAWSDVAVLVVLAPLTPDVVVEEVVAALVDDLGFAHASCVESSCIALKSPGLSAKLHNCSPSPCCTVLNLGFSSCFAQPCVEGKAIASAGRRMPLGGRVLTNLLLENLKLRYYDLSHSWLVAQDILEKTALVAKDAKETKWPPPTVTYVLPDDKLIGFVETGETLDANVSNASDLSLSSPRQSVALSLERYIPEALFRPQDFGIPSAGVAELVFLAISAVKEETWHPFLGRVVLCGGLAKLPGLVARLEAELRELLPSHWMVELIIEEESELSVWQGAVQYALHAEGLWDEEMPEEQTLPNAVPAAPSAALPVPEPEKCPSEGLPSQPGTVQSKSLLKRKPSTLTSGAAKKEWVADSLGKGWG